MQLPQICTKSGLYTASTSYHRVCGMLAVCVGYVKNVESVQCHTAQFSTGNPGCITNMDTQLGQDLLEDRRTIHRTTMFC